MKLSLPLCSGPKHKGSQEQPSPEKSILGRFRLQPDPAARAGREGGKSATVRGDAGGFRDKSGTQMLLPFP